MAKGRPRALRLRGGPLTRRGLVSRRSTLTSARLAPFFRQTLFLRQTLAGRTSLAQQQGRPRLVRASSAPPATRQFLDRRSKRQSGAGPRDAFAALGQDRGRRAARCAGALVPARTVRAGEIRLWKPSRTAPSPAGLPATRVGLAPCGSPSVSAWRSPAGAGVVRRALGSGER
jgi:hypothetical protein